MFLYDSRLSDTLVITLKYVQLEESEERLAIAIYLYLRKRVSLGKAAEIAGMSRWDFIELLSKLGIPIINYPPEELEDEISD